MLNLFLDSNILIDHLCNADAHRCTEELLDKIERGHFAAWISDFVYSEVLGELKNRLEKRKGLKVAFRETISRFELARMVSAVETFKKIPNLNSITLPLDQKMIYDRVRNLCIEAKDAPIILCVEELNKKLSKDVLLVTADMHSIFFKAKKIVKTLHPSFHLDKCTPKCRSYYACQWRDKFTSSRIRR